MLNNICLNQFFQDIQKVKSYSGLVKLLKDAPIEAMTEVRYGQLYWFTIGNHHQNIQVTVDMYNKHINAVERVDNGKSYDLYAETSLIPTNHGRGDLVKMFAIN